MEDKGLKEVNYEDFINMNFRIGEIISCEEVKKSRKLLCFKVNIGEETLQILSGVKEFYNPEDVIGKRVMVLTNLKPITMAGLVSEGLILSAEDRNGSLCFVVPEGEVMVGAEVC